MVLCVLAVGQLQHGRLEAAIVGANGHRVLYRQPSGTSWRLGTSPLTNVLCLGQTLVRVGVGAQHRCQQAAVYGCSGRANTSWAGPCSTIWPRYITATRSERWRTTARLCEMNR